ncbi:MAG: sugar phosphate isomerase/epimerase, partial [Planctomycetota bacterium]
TGRHCPADAQDGRLDIIQCAKYWLLDENNKIRNNIQHICWDGCMFPNSILENPNTWEAILEVMQKIQFEIHKQTEA